MATVSDQPQSMEELLRQMGRRLTQLERRRPGDGINVDGTCENGGGVGGDTSYYGGNTSGDFPNPDFPDSSYPPYLDDWMNDWFNDHPGSGNYTAGANIDIDGSTIHFEVVFTEPGSPRIGQLWFDDTA